MTPVCYNFHLSVKEGGLKFRYDIYGGKQNARKIKPVPHCRKVLSRRSSGSQCLGRLDLKLLAAFVCRYPTEPQEL